jgi:hypothetical protein
MTVRLIFGLGWSLVIGLAGGWLALAPWALGEQVGGDWTGVTTGELLAGLGLVVLAVAGVVVVALQLVSSLRAAGVLASARRPGGAGEGVASSPEMETALIALAQALAEDLDLQRTPAAEAGAASESTGLASRRDSA